MTDEIETGTGYGELDWRLETYAAARLEPSPDASRRMRQAVVLRAADIAAIREFEARRVELEAAQARGHRVRFASLPLRRRATVALLAASLTMASAAAVFAAAPGSALYPTRVWLQTALVPGGEAGAAMHVDLLEQRVEDAEHAAGGGDPNGVEAALTAYIAEIQHAIAAAQDDPGRLAQLEHALQVHLLLLEQLEKDAPSGAQPAIHQAITDSRSAAKDLQVKAGGRPASTPTPGGPGGGNGGSGEGGN